MARHALVLASFCKVRVLDPDTVVAGLHAGRVHHETLEVGVVYDRLEQVLPHALVPPATGAPMGVLPAAVARRQIARDPMRNIWNTAFVKHRLSSAIPHCPLRPGSSDSIIDQTRSSMSWGVVGGFF